MPALASVLRSPWTQGLLRAAALAALGLTVMTGLISGGHLPNASAVDGETGVSSRMAHYLGYAAENIQIAGLERHDRQAVLRALELRQGAAMFAFDAQDAKRRLESLDWVESAQLTRQHPNSLYIAIVERRPLALWQRHGQYAVIDEDGLALASLDPMQYLSLPLVTGQGAPQHAAALIRALDAHPAVKKQIAAAARVGNRRWTLYLRAGTRIALPERGAAQALETVERLHATHRLLDKAVAMIDLRQSNKMILRHLPETEIASRTLAQAKKQAVGG